jgi:hypothetical protein
MVDVDGLGNDAGRGVKDSAEKVGVPEIGDVAATRRRRTGVAAAAGAFVLTLVVVGGVSLFGSDPQPGSDVAASSTAAPAEVVLDSQKTTDGISLAWPSTWHVAAASLTPGIMDPVEIHSVATFPLSAAEGVCGRYPRQAVVDFPADGAFVTIRERFSAVEEASRPAIFVAGAPPFTVVEDDCWDNTDRGGVGTMQFFEFSEGGRSIELLLVIGIDASDEVSREAWEIANSLEVAEADRPDPPTTHTVYAGNAFILDDGDGPEACGAVAESLPPQCSGPRVIGLDWADVPWAESAQGVTWADAYVEFRVIEGDFHLTAVPSERRELAFPDVEAPAVPPDVNVAAIRDELAAFRPGDWPAGLLGVHGLSANLEDGYIELWALLVTDEGREWLDDRFGIGAVVASGSFFPVAELDFETASPLDPRAPSLPGEPDTVRARDPLYYCGTAIGFAIDEAITADAAEELGLTLDAGARSCFEERAIAGQGAEVIVVNATIEGDLIISIHRLLRDGTVEIFDDTTRDAFGQQAWIRYTCHDYDPASLEVAACSEPDVVG